METIVLIKRKACGEFPGDKSWQHAPYPVQDVGSALRLVDWLHKSISKFEYRIVSV